MTEPCRRCAIEAEADDLAGAWAAAKAALPEGWGIVLSVLGGMADAYAVNPVMSVMSQSWEVAANGPTAAAALQALAARLDETP